MQDLHEAWGEGVRSARLDRGLTVIELAEKCGVHETTIFRVEKGTLCPNDTLKWRIAGVLGIRMDRLWAWPTVIPDYVAAAAS